jgi:hypothetical protein
MNQVTADDLFLVTGTLSELQVARSKVNLLEQMEKHLQAKNALSGAVAAASGLYGQAANAVALALYEGEDVYHFAAALGEQVICGTFEHANFLKEGDPIKAVVSKDAEGVLFVHAIMHAETQQFYMPLNTFSGDGALFKHCMAVAKGFTIFGWITSSIIILALNYFDDDPMSFKQTLGLLLFSAIFPPLLMYPTELWMYYSMKGGGAYAEAIFKTFGFPTPRDIDLTKIGYMNHQNTDGWLYAFQAEKMLRKLAGEDVPKDEWVFDETPQDSPQIKPEQSTQGRQKQKAHQPQSKKN